MIFLFPIKNIVNPGLKKSGNGAILQQKNREISDKKIAAIEAALRHFRGKRPAEVLYQNL